MFHPKTIMFFSILRIYAIQMLSHAIDVQDTKVFEIALDDMNYDEESENEMIQPMDLADLKLVEDENRYEPLHSHVKYYNEHYNTEDRKRFSDVLPYLRLHAHEISNSDQEDKPFIAGFKHELDRVTTMRTTIISEAIGTINSTNSNRSKRNVQNLEKLQNHRNGTTNFTIGIQKRVKREEIENRYGTVSDEDVEFFQMARDRNLTISEVETTKFRETQVTYAQYDMYEYGQEASEGTEKYIPSHFLTSGKSTLIVTESSDEESYDYEKLKMEYEQQLEYGIKRGKVLNYTQTEELEDTPRKALKRIMDLKRPKNCTKEELRQIGIKAIECLIYDYQRTRDIATVGKVLTRTWLVLRVWLLIYICLAIPCWCQRGNFFLSSNSFSSIAITIVWILGFLGWCCCCFRCKFCFPRRRILFAKQYYATNPPGTLTRVSKKPEDMKEPIKYEATEHEYDAYSTLEVAIRNV